jgi:hypothetical protein
VFILPYTCALIEFPNKPLLEPHVGGPDGSRHCNSLNGKQEL